MENTYVYRSLKELLKDFKDDYVIEYKLWGIKIYADLNFFTTLMNHPAIKEVFHLKQDGKNSPLFYLRINYLRWWQIKWANGG